MSNATGLLRRRIAGELPAALFEPCPARALTALLVAMTIVALSGALALTVWATPVRALVSLLIGGLYASLFFLGHEAGHGAVVRSRPLQDGLMAIAFVIFLVSPTLWRVWHNRVHHGFTNDAAHDPDNFGRLAWARRSRGVRYVAALSPGEGRWLRLLVVPVWFSAHGQIVLWWQSRRCRGFEGLKRRVAMAETAAMLAFWLALGWSLGASRAAWLIVLPMGVANTILMAYIATNHLLRPLADDIQRDLIDTTMSVTTHRWLDLVHFNFSHHVEHHLFPAMSARHAPRVRQKLREHVPERFLAPSHWAALRLVFATPRFHDAEPALVNLRGDHRIPFDLLTETLRCNGKLPTSALRAPRAKSTCC